MAKSELKIEVWFNRRRRTLAESWVLDGKATRYPVGTRVFIWIGKTSISSEILNPKYIEQFHWEKIGDL